MKRKTMTLNLTDEEIAVLERLVNPSGAALRAAAIEVVRCRHDPRGNFAAAFRDLETALGLTPLPSPEPRAGGIPCGQTVDNPT